MFFSLLFLVFAFGEKAEPQTTQLLYVSTSGSDSNAGTEEKPFLTPEAAIAKAKTLNQPTEIHFEEGNYDSPSLNFFGLFPSIFLRIISPFVVV